jgi:hypothetical protein
MTSREQIYKAELEGLAFAKGQLCGECWRAWPICDKEDEERLSDYSRCPGAKARAALEAAAKVGGLADDHELLAYVVGCVRTRSNGTADSCIAITVAAIDAYLRGAR